MTHIPHYRATSTHHTPRLTAPLNGSNPRSRGCATGRAPLQILPEIFFALALDANLDVCVNMHESASSQFPPPQFPLPITIFSRSFSFLVAFLVHQKVVPAPSPESLVDIAACLTG